MRARSQFFAWCDWRGLGAVGQAAPRRRAHAVRLAGRWPGDAGQSGLGRAWAEACRQHRQDAGARG